MICAEKQHSLRATTDVALKSLNISLQFFTHREQELMMEVAKSRELAEIIQVKLTRIQQTLLDGAHEESTFAEKMRLENELISVKSRIIHLDSQLADLKIEENFTSSHAQQILEQEKQLEISISQQQFSPETFQNYLVTQLERSHETLKMERKKYQSQLQMLLTSMDSKQDHMEFLKNLTITNLNIQIDTASKEIKEASEKLQKLEMQLKAEKQQASDLKSSLSHAHQMLEQEKQLETSISPQQIYPENFPTYLVTQLERSHETLKMERKKFQTQLLTMSTLMDSKQNHMEFLSNLTISNFNIQIDKANKKIEETSEQVRNLEMQLKAAKQQEYDLKSRLNESKSQVSIKESNLVSCNKLHQDCENKVNKWPPPGSVYLRTGIYFFNPILLNWTSAREHCQSLGMDLVAVETEDENTLLVERAKTFFSGYYIMTSGCYSRTEDAVVWYSTGHKATFSKWESGEGNSRNETKCVNLHPVDNRWKEISISLTGPSICEKACKY
ncbi:hypothetical protein B566_EDAN017401 [Ephemera danica]|nr:hypothetical protein B566_EDAN017401 [Ephemera danica]